MSSKRAIRRRSCGGKRRFESPDAAHAARRYVRRQHGDVQEVYSCRFCGGYHLGHHPLDNRPDSKRVRP